MVYHGKEGEGEPSAVRRGVGQGRPRANPGRMDKVQAYHPLTWGASDHFLYVGRRL